MSAFGTNTLLVFAVATVAQAAVYKRRAVTAVLLELHGFEAPVVVAVACCTSAVDLGLVPVAFTVAFAVAAFAVADLLATAFAVVGVAVAVFAVTLAVTAATAPPSELFAPSLLGLVPQRTHHLSTENPCY